MNNHHLLEHHQSLDKPEIDALVSVYQSGSPESSDALLKLLESQGPWMASIIDRYNLTPDVDRDDLLSELTLILIRALKKFDPSRSNITTFVNAVVTKKLPVLIRKQTGHPAGSGTGSIPSSKLEYTEDFSEVTNKDEMDWLFDIMRRCLTEVERRVCMLRMEGLDYLAISNRFEPEDRMSTQTVGRVYRRAIDKIKAEMKPEDEDGDAF